ncbi:hypothetical protein CPB83DRAFT_837983 [Crepidotus variabilis]|uniref:Histone acetyltransferase n=1 Tax=Crepidotus variabilis TaxID=179855 RepID=A0A9P6EA97_9AGAR|nr:hypothetical protein CPB83DRAFT_837983 [Crepidotus variabilis]
MRGLAFPPNQDADRETSYEYGTPFSNVEDIPIDPALGGTPIDPALMMDEPVVDVEPPYQLENEAPERKRVHSDEYDLFQYSGAAQGEEFTQHIPAPYLQIPEEQPPPPPKPKRKRKARRDELCSFCFGTSKKNSRGIAEILLTCQECGRSGHPSCMQLERLSENVQTYPWKCLECKNCEVCQEKGDDARILFCDACDRGWHMDCMVPPLDEPPDGNWHCPLCPPVEPDDMEGQEDQEQSFQGEEEEAVTPVDPIREASVASSSRSAHANPPPKRNRKKASGSKARPRVRKAPVIAVESEVEEEEIDVDETPVASRRGARRRPTTTPATAQTTAPRRRSYARPRPPPSSDEEEGAISATPIRSTKRRRIPVLREPSPPPAPLPRVRLRLPVQRGAKGKEREEEEPSRGLFEDILSQDERDTNKTTIMNSDKVHFERSRLAAEAKLVPPQPTASTSSRTLDNSEDYISVRPRPLRSSTIQQSTPILPKRIDFSNSPGPSTPGATLPKFEPGVLRIRSIRFGPYDIKTWYDAPFPEEYATIPDGRMWICEFCLKYMKSRFGATRHQMKCHARHPPGDEIYRDGIVSIFEVDGRRNKIYCQNLCLLSKMFLDHKSLFYDVEPFLFYVITQVDEFGSRQRQGWGNLLIDFSYLLSKIEQRLGSPEKPLSALGALGYRNYWTLAVMRFLQTAPNNVRLEAHICSATSMTHEDVFNTLIQQGMIFVGEASPPPMRPSPGQTIKFPKGRKNGLSRRQQLQKIHIAQTPEKDSSDGYDSNGKATFVPPKRYEIRFDLEKVETYVRNWEAKGYLKLKPEKLQWTPYLTSRIPQEANLPLLPAMDTAGTSSIAESVKAASETQPTTPSVQLPPGLIDFDEGPVMNGVHAHEDEDGGKEEDELPMAVDKPVLETRRSRRRELTKSPTKDPPLTTRSTRSQQILSPVVAPFTPSRGLRTRTSYANALPLLDEPVSTRSTRRNPVAATPTVRKSSNRRVELTNDEAYAARLAMEEMQQGGRQLRSRRSESQLENKRPVAIPLTPPSKPVRSRKRRRIDSSPDVVDDVDAVVVIPPTATAERQEEEEGEEDGFGDADAEGEEEDGEYEEGEYVAMDVDQRELAKVNGDHRALETQTPEHTDATTLVDANNGSPAEEENTVVKEILDVKSEDAGTPLTNLTSRQSIPSDDTLFMAGGLGTGGGSASKFGNYQGAIHAESDLRSTLGPGTLGLIDLDECHDEDADGEYEEEDAEGEPDPDCFLCFDMFCALLIRAEPSPSEPNCDSSGPGVARLLDGFTSSKRDCCSDSTMQYGHMGLGDRRDPNQMDGNGSTPFHQNGLGQALGSHLTAPVPPAGAYSRDYRNPSTSPPTLNQQGASGHGNPAAQSPLTFAAVQGPGGNTSPGMKRKQVDSMTAQLNKRRRGEAVGGQDDGDNFDVDGGGQGAKHWTDDEKSKLFSWLMGPGQEEHWNALRATKNSCLRDCANQVFGGKKTYQALKGCYERNFNLFKQIYAFENAHGQATGNLNALSEADRLREYERRLQIARKAGSDIGNITARTIDHWQRVGWYELFYRRFDFLLLLSCISLILPFRWHGDPATMRPVQTRTSSSVAPSGMPGANDDGPPGPDDDDPTMDFNDPATLNGLNGITSHDRPHVYINPQDLRENPPPPPQAVAPPTPSMRHPPPHPQQQPQQQQQQQTHLASSQTPQQHPQLSQSQPHPHHAHSQQPPPQLQPLPQPVPSLIQTPISTPADTPVMNVMLTQDIMSRCLTFLNLQTKIAQEKLEILRRRETREAGEWTAKREAEKTESKKDKAAKAFEVINNQNADPGLRQAATEYLRKMFLE